MDKRFKRSFESLEHVFEFIEGFFAAQNIDRTPLFAVHFTVEELFTNMVKYHEGNPNEILISLERADNEVVVRITDFDVEPFDVTIPASVDISSSVQDRTAGGLGIHLVQKMVDTIDYEYANRCSTVTFTKNLEKADVRD